MLLYIVVALVKLFVFHSCTIDVFLRYVRIKKFIIIIIINGQNREFLKNSNWNMPKTPGKMHMYDMVKIDTIVFEIVSCLK